MLSIQKQNNVKFLSGSRGPHGLDLPPPTGENFSQRKCLMMGEVSLETSLKNIMIQDMINSENSQYDLPCGNLLYLTVDSIQQFLSLIFGIWYYKN